MWLTDRATQARVAADQRALSGAVEAARTQHALANQVFADLQNHPPLLALFALHGLSLTIAHPSGRHGQSGTDEGIVVLEFAVCQGRIGRVLAQADIVNWLARHEPAHLRTLQGLLEIEKLPQVDSYGRPEPAT